MGGQILAGRLMSVFVLARISGPHSNSRWDGVSLHTWYHAFLMPIVMCISLSS